MNNIFTLASLVTPSTKLWQKKLLLTSHWDTEIVDQWQLLSHACKDVDSSLCSAIIVCVNSQDIPGLLNLTCHPSDYIEPEAYRKDAFLLGLIKKFPWSHTSINQVANTYKVFVEGEVQCRKRNNDYFSGRRNADLEVYVYEASQLIARVLKDNPLDVLENAQRIEFGPGSNFSVTRKTTAYEKLTAELEVTSTALPYAQNMMRNFHSWNQLHADAQGVKDNIFTLVNGGRIEFANKTAKVKRIIEVAPLWNTILQRPIGKYIGKRLTKFDLNLKTAQAKHKLMAQASSIIDGSATVDLKNASGTISTSVIMEFFPYEWFRVMDDLRCQAYRIEGKWYPYEQFSAMGCGFTFEMETLLFWALAKAVVPKHLHDQVSVYGDDIILPKEFAPTLISLLDYCGFSCNMEKSFISGPFRESCGGDYFSGIDVRPFNQKDVGTVRTLVLLHNYLVRGNHFYSHPKLTKFLRKQLSFTAECISGPADYAGDGHLVSWNYEGTSFNEIVVKKCIRYPARGEDANYVHALYQQQFAHAMLFSDTLICSMTTRSVCSQLRGTKVSVKDGVKTFIPMPYVARGKRQYKKLTVLSSGMLRKHFVQYDRNVNGPFDMPKSHNEIDDIHKRHQVEFDGTFCVKTAEDLPEERGEQRYQLKKRTLLIGTNTELCSVAHYLR